MRIISHKRLKVVYETPGREDAKVALERWYELVEHAEWKMYSDIRDDFGDANSVILKGAGNLKILKVNGLGSLER